MSEIVKKQLSSLKNAKRNIECKKKGILILVYKQALLFEKFKEPDKFFKIYKKMEQVKIVKVL